MLDLNAATNSSQIFSGFGFRFSLLLQRIKLDCCFYLAKIFQSNWISDIWESQKSRWRITYKSDLSFSSLRHPNPTDSTEHSESLRMLPLNSSSLRFEITDLMADAKSSACFSESSSPERLQGQRTIGETIQRTTLTTMSVIPVHKSSQPVTRQQLSAIRQVETRCPTELQTESHNGKERWFKWLGMCHVCLTSWSEKLLRHSYSLLVLTTD